MNFDEQSIEMRRTLIESSVGKVSISSHALETHLKTILFSCLGFSDEEFDNQWEKPRTLGKIINELKPFNIFSQEEMESLDSAKNTRNSFTHSLSECYEDSIKNGTMYKLFKRFDAMRLEIEAVNNLVKKKLHEQASSGGVNVNEVKEAARENVNSWEGA